MIGVDPTVRGLSACDGPRLVRMLRRLSNQSVHRRFFAPLADPEATARLLMESGGDGHNDAIVALLGDDIIAVASYDRHADAPSVADVAVLVEDGWQHHGLGRRLVRALAKQARSN